MPLSVINLPHLAITVLSLHSFVRHHWQGVAWFFNTGIEGELFFLHTVAPSCFAFLWNIHPMPNSIFPNFLTIKTAAVMKVTLTNAVRKIRFKEKQLAFLLHTPWSSVTLVCTALALTNVPCTHHGVVWLSCAQLQQGRCPRKGRWLLSEVGIKALCQAPSVSSVTLFSLTTQKYQLSCDLVTHRKWFLIISSSTWVHKELLGIIQNTKGHI